MDGVIVRILLKCLDGSVVEQLISNQQVVSSNLTRGSTSVYIFYEISLVYTYMDRDFVGDITTGMPIRVRASELNRLIANQ